MERATDEQIGIARENIFLIDQMIKAFTKEYERMYAQHQPVYQLTEPAFKSMRLQYAYLLKAMHNAQLTLVQRNVSQHDSRPSWAKFLGR